MRVEMIELMVGEVLYPLGYCNCSKCAREERDGILVRSFRHALQLQMDGKQYFYTRSARDRASLNMEVVKA